MEQKKIKQLTWEERCELGWEAWDLEDWQMWEDREIAEFEKRQEDAEQQE